MSSGRSDRKPEHYQFLGGPSSAVYGSAVRAASPDRILQVLTVCTGLVTTYDLFLRLVVLLIRRRTRDRASIKDGLFYVVGLQSTLILIAVLVFWIKADVYYVRSDLYYLPLGNEGALIKGGVLRICNPFHSFEFYRNGGYVSLVTGSIGVAFLFSTPIA